MWLTAVEWPLLEEQQSAAWQVPTAQLATTIKERFDAVGRGMLEHRSNAFVESMNGQLQQAKRAARGYRTAKKLIALADLRQSRLKNLSAQPFAATAAVR